jgi:hypothetical protein
VDKDLAQMVQLSEPRNLNAVERGLLDFILDGPNVLPELRAQAASALVVSTCDCGCRSVARDGAYTNGKSRGELPDISTLEYQDVA